jgi:hypothetical protein
MKSIFTILLVSIVPHQVLVKSPVACGFLLFTLTDVILLYISIKYIRFGIADHALTIVTRFTMAD